MPVLAVWTSDRTSFNKQYFPECFGKTSVDAVVGQAIQCDMVDSLLYRLAYGRTEDKVVPKRCVPSGACAKFELPGRGSKSLGFRERLFMEVHHSTLGGHVGRDRTMERLAMAWWWPGMCTDVMRWCAGCERFQRENRPTARTAWATSSPGCSARWPARCGGAPRARERVLCLARHRGVLRLVLGHGG